MSINPFQSRMFAQMSIERLIAIFTTLSIVIAGWVQYIQCGRINIDSVLYIESAKLIASGHWQAALNIYNWPFYSICLAVIHRTTDLNFELSAQLLNMLLFGITTLSFLNIVKLCGGRKLEVISGAIILFSARHIVGAMLTMPMRDEGFWAFLLSALFFMLRFIQSNQLRDAFFWQLAILIAALYRVEGFAFMLFLPLSICLMPERANKQSGLLQCYGLSILVFVLILTFALLTNDSMLHSSRLQEILPSNMFNQITQQLSEKSASLAGVLGKYLSEYAYIVFISSFLVIIVIKTINAAGFINVGLAFLAIFSKKSRLNQQAYLLLRIAAFISIITLLFTLARSFVIVGRYVAPLAFILMIFASFSIRIFVDWHKQKPVLISGILLLLAILSVSNLVKNIKPEYNGTFYQKEAAIWLLKQNVTKSPVLYDNILSAYYAGEPYSEARRDVMSYLEKQLTSHQLNFEYLMVHYEGNEEKAAKMQLIAPLKPYYQEIKRFKSYKNNKNITIYKRIKSTN